MCFEMGIDKGKLTNSRGGAPCVIGVIDLVTSLRNAPKIYMSIGSMGVSSMSPREKPPEMKAVEAMDCSIGCSDEVTVWDRPVVSAWVTRKPIQAMLDIGCSQTLIRVDLVPQENIQWSKLVQLRCIHRGVDQYERGFLQLKVANHEGCMQVGVATDLNYEMIIGRDWPPLYDVLEEV